MRSIEARKLRQIYGLVFVTLLAWPLGQGLAAESPSIWIVLEPKKFGYSAEEIFRRVDENKDGRIDEVELRLHKMALFSERDVNKDDVLDKKELAHLDPGVFDEMDADGDGKISGYEFNQAARVKLSSMDANKDGTVSLEELRAHLNSIRKN